MKREEISGVIPSHKDVRKTMLQGVSWALNLSFTLSSRFLKGGAVWVIGETAGFGPSKRGHDVSCPYGRSDAQLEERPAWQEGL